MKNVNEIMKNHPLAQLVDTSAFVGWVYSIDYDTAKVMTNDLWKARAHGVPHNSFLVAASFDPADFANVDEEDREVILLRVVASAMLPQDDDLVRTKIDHFQQQTSVIDDDRDHDYDDLTRNQLQFGGLECRVLGTFYVRDDVLHMGSDLESFATAASLNVYRPQGGALSTIVNYVDPIRKRKAEEEARELGITRPIAPFQIGTVRYTSSDRLHRANDADMVSVTVQPSDFLARRTAVLGMTRTGKSNMVKQMVSVVKRVADESGVKIGQIIYDINGEYANANRQDKGALADVFPDDTVRYRMLKPPKGFVELRNNFFEQLNEGLGIVKRELQDAGRVTSDYIRAFVNMSLDEPDKRDYEEHSKWAVRAAAYRTLLYKAGFGSPANYVVKFPASAEIRKQVEKQLGDFLPDTSAGLLLPQAAQWFDALRTLNQQAPVLSTTKKAWVDDTLGNLLDMLAQKSKGSNNFISGYSILADAVKYHSPARSSDAAKEIYDHLVAGKIVILDLSVGDPNLREKLSQDIAVTIFQESMKVFVNGNFPPNIVVYVEEAHNLIGKDKALTETWPRLAKEGAKYRIALVYATQEVSSVHPNILANTENWIITHLNNEREVRELAKFYDFSDFSRSLVRAQDIGFARVKTLSSPFVVPVQIDQFNPEAAKENSRVTQAAQPVAISRQLHPTSQVPARPQTAGRHDGLADNTGIQSLWEGPEAPRRPKGM